jgi:hypothetical protein
MDRKGKRNPMWGRKHTERTKEKMSVSALKRWGEIRNAVCCLDDKIKETLKRELKRECFIINNEVSR